MVSEKSEKQGGGGSFANPTIENIVMQSSKFSWLIVIGAVVGHFLWALYLVWVASLIGGWGLGLVLGPEIVAQIAWGIISLVVALVFVFIYVIPKFVKKVAARDWTFLVNDVIKFGTFQMPKMLFFGILIAIFGYGWGSLGILLPAVLIIWAGPVPVSWKAGEAPAKKAPAKEKDAAKPAPKKEPVAEAPKKDAAKPAPKKEPVAEAPKKEPAKVAVKEEPVAEAPKKAPAPATAAKPGTFTCEYCGKEYKTERGLANHADSCPSKP